MVSKENKKVRHAVEEMDAIEARLFNIFEIHQYLCVS